MKRGKHAECGATQRRARDDDWSMVRLAKESGVSISSIKRFENELSQPVSDEIRTKLHRTLSEAGITFLASEGQGEGVRFNPPILAEAKEPM